jgi:hypothetical protein
MIYLLAYKLANGNKALAINDNNAFIGTENLEDAKKLIPKWNGYHVVDMTWSASATLYWMAFHPHIVGFESMKEVEKILVDKKKIHERSFAGSVNYTLVNSEMNVIFDPKLIDRETFETAKPFWEEK